MYGRLENEEINNGNYYYLVKFKSQIAIARGKPMTKSGSKKKFRKSGINILGLAIYLLIIIGVFTKL